MAKVRKINVKIRHYNTDAVLSLKLPADTTFEQLHQIVYDEKFVFWQKPGYKFIYKEHLCNMTRTLADYIPEDAKSIELRLLNVPVIMV